VMGVLSVAAGGDISIAILSLAGSNDQGSTVPQPVIVNPIVKITPIRIFEIRIETAPRMISSR